MVAISEKLRFLEHLFEPNFFVFLNYLSIPIAKFLNQIFYFCNLCKKNFKVTKMQLRFLESCVLKVYCNQNRVHWTQCPLKNQNEHSEIASVFQERLQKRHVITAQERAYQLFFSFVEHSTIFLLLFSPFHLLGIFPSLSLSLFPFRLFSFSFSLSSSFLCCSTLFQSTESKWICFNTIWNEIKVIHVQLIHKTGRFANCKNDAPIEWNAKRKRTIRNGHSTDDGLSDVCWFSGQE